MHYDYKTCGTCSRAIHFDITDDQLARAIAEALAG